MKYKKGDDKLAINKLITFILVALVVVVAFIAAYNFGLIEKLDVFPSFTKNNVSEEVIPDECNYLVARIIRDRIYFCNGEVNCDEKTPGDYRGIKLSNSDLISSCPNCAFKGFLSQYKIGVFVGNIVYLNPEIIEGVGTIYFKAKENFEREGVTLNQLVNLDKSHLIGESYLCRDEKVSDANNYQKVKNIEIGGKNFYFNIAGVLSRQGIGNTFVFYDEKLTEIAKSYIDQNSRFVYTEGDKEVSLTYVFENTKHTDLIKQVLPIDNSNGQIGVDTKGNNIIGFISGGAPIDGSFETNNVIRFYYGSEDNKKFVGPWIKTEYWLEYGTLGRIEDKPWACMNNNCLNQN